MMFDGCMFTIRTYLKSIMSEMSPAEIKSIRQALGMSQAELAVFLRLRGADASRTVRGWEAGQRNGKAADIPGPVQVLLGAIMESQAVREHFGLTLQERN